MSRTRLAGFIVSVWVAAFSAAAQNGDATSSFAPTEAQAMVPRTGLPSGIAEQSRTCTYQGGPKSGNWACR